MKLPEEREGASGHGRNCVVGGVMPLLLIVAALVRRKR